MPSQWHEALLLLFRNEPSLAPKSLRDSRGLELPACTHTRIDSADLTEVQPAEYRADLVVLPLNGKPVFGIVVEVQLSSDEDKRYVWPAYLASLRARIRCPVCVLVVTPDENVARWASKPIELGPGNRFLAWVLGPADIPEITDVARAKESPELAVLSAMAHGRDADASKAAQIAIAAQAAAAGLDAERAGLYFDLVMYSLSEVARRAFEVMDPAKYEYQSEFAKRYYGQGKADGKAEGRAEIVLRLLARRFGALPEGIATRIRNAGAEELDGIVERLLTAATLDGALGER